MSDCSSNAFKVPEKPELLPCPFHEEPITPRVNSHYYSDYIDGGWWAEAECPRCDVILTVDQCESEQEALKDLETAWNTRWQPICHIEVREPLLHRFLCSECHETCDPGSNYCSNCGRKVVD